MGFFDLNIPYHEADRQVTAADKAKLKAHRLKLVIKTAELGYTGVAYNRVIKGVMSESDRCSISLFPLSSLLKVAPSLSSSVKFHRDLLNVPVSTPFRQYTRLTVVIESSAQAAALNSGNPILKSYDIVAVRPMNQNAFEQACQTSEVDVIAIDFTEKLPFRLKQPVVKAAIERGVYFEITYSGLIMDAQVRRQMISNAKLLAEWTRGKYLVVSSGAPSASEIRGPIDVANLLSLFGLQFERAKAAISKNCRYVITKSLRKKHYFKEAIKVELMPSGGQSNLDEALVDDWLKWDPISSGEGDLLLDDIAKSFSASEILFNPVKVVQFASALKSLPSHGFQVKDIIPGMGTTSEGPKIVKNFSMMGETNEAAYAKGIFKRSSEPVLLHKVDQTSMHRRQESSRREDSAISPRNEESNNVKNYFGVEEMEAAVDMNGMSERSCAVDLLNKEGQVSMQTRHETSDYEDSAMSNKRDNNSVHVEEHHSCVVSRLEFRSEELDACPCSPETSLPFPNCVTGFDENLLFQDDSTINDNRANDTEVTCTSGSFVPMEVSIHSKDFSATLTCEESEMPVRSIDGLAASTPKEEDETVLNWENNPSLMSPDGPSNQELCGVNYEKRENSVTLADDYQVQAFVDNMKEENKFLIAESEPWQKHLLEEQKEIKKTHPAAGENKPVEYLSGKGQLKRKASYKHFLFPFKNLLMSKHSRKKVRKLNRPHPM